MLYKRLGPGQAKEISRIINYKLLCWLNDEIHIFMDESSLLALV